MVILGKMRISDSRKRKFDVVEIVVVDHIRYRRRRNLAISPRCIMHMMRIDMYYTYFDSELGLWCDANYSYLKARNKWLKFFMNRFKFNKKRRTNKKLNNLEEV